MSNTDKYEGHTEGPWTVFVDDNDGPPLLQIEGPTHTIAYDVGRDADSGVVEERGPNMATAQLIADAPLLLAEVERLREELRITQSNFSMVRNALANQYPEIEEAIWKVIE